jgi:hypothetical protein
MVGFFSLRALHALFCLRASHAPFEVLADAISRYVYWAAAICSWLRIVFFDT